MPSSTKLVFSSLRSSSILVLPAGRFDVNRGISLSGLYDEVSNGHSLCAVHFSQNRATANMLLLRLSLRCHCSMQCIGYGFESAVGIS